jgi:hypothetical protein
LRAWVNADPAMIWISSIVNVSGFVRARPAIDATRADVTSSRGAFRAAASKHAKPTVSKIPMASFLSRGILTKFSSHRVTF